MLKKINRKDALKRFTKFPQSDFVKGDVVYTFPETFGSCVLTLKPAPVKRYIKLLTSELQKLLGELQISIVYFLGDHKGSWVRQYNEYKPVREALEFLEGKNIGTKFNGALQVEVNDLHPFIIHLFWLTRCNASFPDVYFLNEGQDILLYLCKHGNIHVDYLTNKSNKLISSAIKKTTFKKVTGKNCIEPFSKTGAIKGRQTII